jgi:hypothetical protein
MERLSLFIGFENAFGAAFVVLLVLCGLWAWISLDLLKWLLIPSILASVVVFVVVLRREDKR